MPRGACASRDVTPGSLVGLVWCGRMLMLEEAFRDSPKDPNEMTMETVDQFQEM